MKPSPGPIHRLRFYDDEPNFKAAFRAKHTVYGPAMRTLSEDNPSRPTDIGSRRVEQIPAAVIRMLLDTWLVSNCLSLGDRVSMGVSVETRLPFLDVGLIELVMALRSKQPDHTLGQKAWLRMALKGVLPEEIRTRPKAGFRPPVQEWLLGVITRYGSALCNGNLTKAGVLNEKKVNSLLHGLPKQRWSELFFLYKLVLLEMWWSEVVRT
jgi:asparagine synthase (glutamine-hydrolysing)